MVASQHRAVAGSAAQDRRAGGGRGLWRPVDGAGAGAVGRRGDGAGARRLRRRRQHAQRRRRQRRHDAGQGLLRQGRAQRSRGMEEGDVAHAERRRRFAGPGRDGDPARGHRVRLAHERPLQRRLHAAHYDEQAAKVGTYNTNAGLGTYMVPREQQREEIASDYYYGGMVVERTGQLHPALYYGGLLKAAHKAGATPVCPVRRREDRAQSRRLHRADEQGADRGARGGDRDQRLHRRRDADAEAPAGAGGEPHHRHRGAAGGPGQEPDPEGPRRQRYQARALLLPALARRQAA